MRNIAAIVACWLFAAGCADMPKGFGDDRAHSLTLGGGMGFALDERALGATEGPTLLGMGIFSDYYFIDQFALGLKYKNAIDVADDTRHVHFHELTLDAKLQGDIGSLKPYVTIGTGWILAVSGSDAPDATDHATNHWVFEWGGGVDVYFTEDWALTIDATLNHSNTQVFGIDDTYMFETLIGLKYKF